MPITLLHEHQVEKRYVIPASHGIEERDLRAFPLPPGTDLRLLNVVVDDLRKNGYVVDYEVKRETLVDWDATNHQPQRSFDGRTADPEGLKVLRFVTGGISIRVTVNGREVDLLPYHFRGGRTGIRFALAGRP